MFSSSPLRFLLAVAAILLAATAFAEPPIRLSPFSTDGCSLFPDRSLVSDSDWCGCCIAHDFAYWRGGTAEQRLAADEQLRACVLKASGSSALADLMYAGVRAGGAPYSVTSYRWAYGWPLGRTYEPLTPAEQVAAASLQAQYLASHPQLTCEK